MTKGPFQFREKHGGDKWVCQAQMTTLLPIERPTIVASQWVDKRKLDENKLLMSMQGATGELAIFIAESVPYQVQS